MGAGDRHETPAPVVETGSSAETEAHGARFAAALEPGDVVLVSGELGAGKTTWVRGALRALGIERAVTSPTFTIARRYDDGRVPVSHLDLYRLAGSAGEDPAIFEGEIGPDRITFVEWPDAHAPLLAGARVAARVVLEHAGGDRRAVRVERPAGPGSWVAPRPAGSGPSVAGPAGGGEGAR